MHDTKIIRKQIVDILRVNGDKSYKFVHVLCKKQCRLDWEGFVCKALMFLG